MGKTSAMGFAVCVFAGVILGALLHMMALGVIGGLAVGMGFWAVTRNRA